VPIAFVVWWALRKVRMRLTRKIPVD
jgi:hypothetical protein